MNFDGDTLTDLVFIDTWPERYDRAHVFMARREVLVERQAALNRRRRPVIDDFEIGGADRHRIDAHQHFRLLRYWDRLGRDVKLTRLPEHPSPLRIRDRKFVVICFNAGGCVHVPPPKIMTDRSIRDGLLIVLCAWITEFGRERAGRSHDLVAHQGYVIVAGAHY